MVRAKSFAPPPPVTTGESAEVFENKGVGNAPLLTKSAELHENEGVR